MIELGFFQARCWTFPVHIPSFTTPVPVQLCPWVTCPCAFLRRAHFGGTGCNRLFHLSKLSALWQTHHVSDTFENPDFPWTKTTQCFSRKIYHPNNAQLGMAVMRAGVTHWHAGLIEAGHGLICKAYAILLITHGPSHPITKDLEVGAISCLVSALYLGKITVKP